MAKDEKSFQSSFNLPESFYDLLAYIIPSTYFILGIFILIKPQYLEKILKISTSGSIIIDLLATLVLVGGIYFIGQVTTTLSYYTIAIPLITIMKKRITGHSILPGRPSREKRKTLPYLQIPDHGDEC